MARGLLNHYYGTKRELYLEVVRTLVTITDRPGADVQIQGPLRTRVERSVERGRRGDRPAGAGAGRATGRPARAPRRHPRYAGLVKAAIRGWARDETLDRDEVRLLLARVLETIVRDVLAAP